MAEEEGRRRGCIRVALTTLTIEAPGFYLKQGYDVAATIDCEPPGLTRHYTDLRMFPDMSVLPIAGCGSPPTARAKGTGALARPPRIQPGRRPASPWGAAITRW